MALEDIIELLEKAKQERYIKLDLSNHGLLNLPAEIGDLEALRQLILGDDIAPSYKRNELTNLPGQIKKGVALLGRFRTLVITRS